MKKNKIKKIVITVIILIVLLGYILRVWYINANTFKVSKRIYEVGQECEFKDFKYKILSCEIMTADEIQEQFGVEPRNPYDFEVEYITLKMEMQYIGEKESEVGRFTGYFMSGTWYNGVEVQLQSQINAGNDTFISGERKELWSFGVLPQGQFLEREWNKRQDMKFEIIFQTLPEEVRMKCN